MKRRNVLGTALMAGALGAVGGGAAAAPSRGGSRTIGKVETSDCTELFVREWGNGPPVLFVHSWALESAMWNYQFAGLGERGLRCIAYDRRGHGRSAAPGGGYDLDTLADDLAAVIAKFDLRKLVLVGHSMGAAEIVRYLSRHGSDRVRKVALLSPTTPYLTKSHDNPYGAPAAFFASLREEWATDFPKWIEENKKPFFTPETSPAMMDWIARMMESASLPAVLACNTALAAADLRPDLQAVNCPTLIIHGDKDASAPLEITGRRTAAGIAGADFRIYEGAPHGLFVTYAKRLNADLLEFSANH